MSIYLYQTFQLKQEAFHEAMENLGKIRRYRMDNFQHDIDILTPMTGPDHTYALLCKYEGMAEMELQNLKMFADEEYLSMIDAFFLEHIVQGSMNTQLYRVTNDIQTKQEED